MDGLRGPGFLALCTSASKSDLFIGRAAPSLRDVEMLAGMVILTNPARVALIFRMFRCD